VLISLLTGKEDNHIDNRQYFEIHLPPSMLSNQKQYFRDMGDSYLVISVFRTVVEGNNRSR
jgi:hypothetical protein